MQITTKPNGIADFFADVKHHQLLATLFSNFFISGIPASRPGEILRGAAWKLKHDQLSFPPLAWHILQCPMFSHIISGKVQTYPDIVINLSLYLKVSIFSHILTSECIAKYICFIATQKGIS